MRKKKWSTPLLTILVRGKPEERALTACKTGASGPGSNWSGCLDETTCTSYCSASSGS